MIYIFNTAKCVPDCGPGINGIKAMGYAIVNFYGIRFYAFTWFVLSCNACLLSFICPGNPPAHLSMLPAGRSEDEGQLEVPPRRAKCRSAANTIVRMLRVLCVYMASSFVQSVCSISFLIRRYAFQGAGGEE